MPVIDEVLQILNSQAVSRRMKIVLKTEIGADEMFKIDSQRI